MGGRRCATLTALALVCAGLVASPGAAQDAEGRCAPGPHPSGFGVVHSDCSATVTEAELLGVNTLISEQMLRIDRLAASLFKCEQTQLAALVKCQGDAAIDGRKLRARIAALEWDVAELLPTPWRVWWPRVVAVVVGVAVGVVGGFVLALELTR